MSVSISRLVRTRAVAALSIAVLVWAIVAAGWLDRTVVAQLDQGLRDFYLALTVDGTPDEAPGLLHLVFDNRALAAHGLPPRVPIDAIRDMLDSARTSSETVVVDIDLATRTDADAVMRFANYLEGWSADSDAALLLLAYPLYDVPYHQMASFHLLDAVIRSSPNIRWASVGTYADADGVIRSYEYWTCVDTNASGTQTALASVAAQVWARHAFATPADAATAVDEAMATADARCNSDGARSSAVRLLDRLLPRSGIIEFQTSVDATRGDPGETGQFAPDGLPRLMSVGYCDVWLAACGIKGEAVAIGGLVAHRIVLISADNDFSRDEHPTPVGYMAGSVILGNAARALINSGPPVPAAVAVQLLIVLAAASLIQAAWSVMNRWRAALRTRSRRPLLLKLVHGLVNPAVVQWLAFALADVAILLYYYFAFPGSDWNGLVGASFGATTVAAVAAFNDWWSQSWDEERKEDT